MDIGRFNNNTHFYKGYEPEEEITLKVKECPELNIHIWDGFFYDIFGNPPMDGNGWNGFTRDFNQFERTYDSIDVKIDIDEYLADLYSYRSKQFKFTDTYMCYNLIISFLEYAKSKNMTILVSWDA